MTTAKWIVSIILASAASSYVTFHLSAPPHGKSNLSLDTEDYAYSQANEASRARVVSTDMNEDIASSPEDCEKIFEKLNKKVSDKKFNNIEDKAPTTPIRVEDLQFSYEKKQNEIASFREFVGRAGEDSLSVITENYTSEPVDPDWAYSKEDELQRILNTNETLNKSNPLELSCKSQNCRVVLSSYDEDLSESLYSAFKNEALKGNEDNKKQVVTYFSDPSKGEIYLYLSKSTSRSLFDKEMQ